MRGAAQALLLAELRRIGPEGRKKVVDNWSVFLPSYVDPALSLLTEQQQQQLTGQQGAALQDDDCLEEEDGMLGGSEENSGKDVFFV